MKINVQYFTYTYYYIGITSTNNIEVTGSTSAGAVVSVNEEITTADANGVFVVSIVLEEGPNIIEVIASDEAGNVASAILTITLVEGG